MRDDRSDRHRSLPMSQRAPEPRAVRRITPSSPSSPVHCFNCADGESGKVWASRTAESRNATVSWWYGASGSDPSPAIAANRGSEANCPLAGKQFLGGDEQPACAVGELRRRRSLIHLGRRNLSQVLAEALGLDDDGNDFSRLDRFGDRVVLVASSRSRNAVMRSSKSSRVTHGDFPPSSRTIPPSVDRRCLERELEPSLRVVVDVVGVGQGTCVKMHKQGK